MTTITVNAELLFELESKQDWINKIPEIMPVKRRGAESWIWLDKNGNVFEVGLDFSKAEKHNTYPCKVYRPLSVSEWAESQQNS